jgi:hypothetical protein
MFEKMRHSVGFIGLILGPGIDGDDDIEERKIVFFVKKDLKSVGEDERPARIRLLRNGRKREKTGKRGEEENSSPSADKMSGHRIHRQQLSYQSSTSLFDPPNVHCSVWLEARECVRIPGRKRKSP